MRRSLQKPRYLLVNLPFLLSLAVFLLSGCAFPSSTHQTYIYRGPGLFNGVWRPGNTLTIQWRAEAGPLLSEDTPSTVLLQVSLLGPFKGTDDILGPLRAYGKNADLSRIGPTAAATAPLGTDNWTKKTFTTTFAFPSQLKAGFYDLVVMATVTPDRSSSTRTDAPIQVLRM